MVVSKKLLPLALMLLILGGCAKANSPETPGTSASELARVSGTVTADDTGDPMAQVSLSFYSDDGQIVGQSIFTDDRGRYSIQLPPGIYRVLTNSVSEVRPLGWNGYAPVWTNGELTDSGDQRLELKGGDRETYNVSLPRVWPSQGKVNVPDARGTSGNITAVKFRDGTVFASIPLPPSGEYTFPLPDGEWQIQVDAPGYKQAVSTRFVIAKNSITLPEIRLEPA